MPVIGSGNNVYGGIFQATASGAIANGKACIINANGTVSQATSVAGGKFIYTNTSNGGRLYSYDLATPFDTTQVIYNGTQVGTYANAYSYGSYTQSNVALENNMTEMHDFCFNADGTKLFALDRPSTTANSRVAEFTMSTPYDIANLTFVDVYVIGSYNNYPKGLAFKSDGTRMWTTKFGDVDVYGWDLSTGFDVSTASYNSLLKYTTSISGGFIQAIQFKPDGTKMYLADHGAETIKQYSLSAAWGTASASYDSIELDVSAYHTSPEGFVFNDDGTKIYIVGDDSNDVTEYSLSTPYALNTASFVADTDLYLSTQYACQFAPGASATASNYVGVSVGAVSDGETASIRVVGGLDTNQSGLTPNALAYVQVDGSISSSTTACQAGWALSPTTILIRGNYKNIL